MPNRRFDWHEHIKDVEGEYQAARIAVDRLKAEVVADPGPPEKDDEARIPPRCRQEPRRDVPGPPLCRFRGGAPLVRPGAAQRLRPVRSVASVLIDSIGGRRGQGISTTVREGAHAVRELRNYWAHENEITPAPMTIAQARARLQTYLSWLPDEWG